MRTPISFFVTGKPQPSGSKRAFVLRKGGAYTGRAIVTDANPKARDWKIDVQHAAREAYRDRPLDGPVRLTLTFFLDRPKGHYGSGANAFTVKPSAPKRPQAKPDVLKLARGTEDALTGILYVDDSQIVIERLEKAYSGKEGPGCLIEIQEEEF